MNANPTTTRLAPIQPFPGMPPSSVRLAVEDRRRLTQLTPSAVRRYQNPIPRREHPLVLDSSEYDQLLDTLMQELQPSNVMAAHLARLLAGELCKLHFCQRVEFAVIDTVQAVDDAALRRSREDMQMRVKGKSVEQCERELSLLTPIRRALESGVPPEVDAEHLPWLTAVVWRRITMYEQQCVDTRKQIEQIVEDLKTATDAEDREYWAQERDREAASLHEAQGDDKRAGRCAHGIESQQDVLDILSGRSPLPKGTKELWLQTLGTQIAIVTEQRNRLNRHTRLMEDLRTVALNLAADKIPQLAPIQKHSSTIWRNIERCLKQLAALGVNLKAATPTTGTPYAPGDEHANH